MHVRLNRLSMWLTVLCAVIMVSVVGTLIPALASSTVKIAMITAKTGKAGKSNSISFPAARFAVDQINKDGGILGLRVELLEYDNKSSAEGSAAAARQAIEDGVVAVVGCNWSSHSLAMAKVLQKAQVPMVSHMSTNPSVTQVGDYIFRVCFTDSFQGLGLARFSVMRLKDRTAVVLVDKSRTYSVGLAQTFTETFEQYGGQVLWQGEYDSDNIPYDKLLEGVAKHDPDALFVPGGYVDVAGFFGRARDMKARWHLLSADGIGIRLYDYIEKRAHGVYYSGHWSRWVNTQLSRDFVRKYEAQVGPIDEDAQPLVYDSFMVIRDAIERAGTLDGPKVRKALSETTDFEGVTGNIRFNEYGDPIKPMVINEFRFGGILYLDQIYP